MATKEQRLEIYFRKQELLQQGVRSNAELYELFPNIPKGSLKKIITREGRILDRETKASREPVVEEVKAKVDEEVRGDREPIPVGNASTHKVDFKVDGDVAVATSVSTRILTLDDLMTACKVDLDYWEVDHHLFNKWEVARKDTQKELTYTAGAADGYTIDSGGMNVTALIQVKAWLKRRQDSKAAELIQDMIEDAKYHIPTISIPRVSGWGEGNHMLEMSIPDLHFGKQAWGEATGKGDYDMAIARDLFTTAVDKLFAYAEGTGIDQFLLPLGNDLFHADNSWGTTKKGTQVLPVGDYRERFRAVREMVVRCIDMLSSVAPVRIVIVPGNHDRETMFFLGDALDIWYRKTPEVYIDNGPGLRKYVLYGKNLIGFTHGNEEKHDILPGLMSHEAKAEWALADYYEYHIGHTHTKKEVKYLPVDEVGGVRIRTIPSLCKTDDWHYDKGYVMGVRAAEGYLYHHLTGLRAVYNYSPGR